MDKSVDGGSLAAVLHSHAGFDLIKETFYDESFAQQHFLH